MPVEELINSAQTFWKPDHLVETKVYHHSLKHTVKKVAVIGAGPAGVRDTLFWDTNKLTGIAHDL